MAIIKLHNPVLAENSSFGNFIVESLSSDPTLTSTAASGRIWFNSTDKKLKGAFLNAAGTSVDLKYLADQADITTINTSITNLGNTINGSVGDLGDLTTSTQTTIVAAVNELDSEIGTLSTLTTTQKGTIVGSINELDAQLGNVALTTTATTITGAVAEHEADIGTVANLTTTATNLTGAVNELDAEVGTLSTLTTTQKGTIVGSINELDAEVGTLSTLTTTEKGTVVGSINELDAQLGNVTLTTTAQTVTGAIAEHEADIGTVGNLTTTATNLTSAVNELDAQLGNVALTTTAQTVSGAIAEHEADIGTVGNLTTSATNLTGAVNELDAQLGNNTLTTTAQTITGAVNELDAKQGDATLTTTAQNISAAINELNTNKVEKLNITGATVGSTAEIPVITYNAQGQITNATVAEIQIDLQGVTDLGSTSTNPIGLHKADNTAGITADFVTTANAVTAGSLDVSGAAVIDGALTVGTVSAGVTTVLYGNTTIANDGTTKGNLVIQGNLTVSGTTTTVNTEQLSIADNVVTLNSDFVTGTPTENAGLEVNRGDLGIQRIIQFNEATDTVQVAIWNSTTSEFDMVDVSSANDNSAFQTEVDNTQASLGFGGTDGSVYTATSTNYIAGLTVTADVSKLDTELKRVETGVGAWGTLTTTATTVVTAINELDAQLGNVALTTTAQTVSGAVAEHEADIGTVANLTTTSKVLVGALNELDGELGNVTLTTTAQTVTGAIAEHEADIGTVANLTTTSKVLVGAVNELDAEVGVISTLTTDVKTTVVAAINEVESHANNLYDVIGTYVAEDATAMVVTGTNYLNSGSTTVSAALTTLDSTLKTRVDNVNTAAGISGDAYVVSTSANYLKAADFTNASLAQNLFNADVLLDSKIKAVSDLATGSTGNLATLSTDEKTTVVGALNEVDGHADDLYTVLGVTEDATLTGFTGLVYVTNNSPFKGAVESLDGDLARVETGVGVWGSLTTTSKVVVGAINELDSFVGNDTLTTTGTTLTAAVNEHDAEIGTLSTLTTVAKNTLVAAINELDTDLAAEVTRATGVEGTLSNLTTSVKTNLVSAINSEVSRATSAESALGTRVDNVNTAAGITGDTYTADATTNYLTGATTLMNADKLLDSKVKATINAYAGTTGSTQGTALVGYKGYTETDVTIVNPTVEITAGTLEAALDDIASSVNLKIHELENRYVKAEVASAEKSDVYTLVHNLDTEFVDVSVQVYDSVEATWRFDLVVVEVVDANTVTVSLAGGIAQQIRYVIHGY